MKVCIDGLAVCSLKGTGLYTYTYELMDSLLASFPQPYYHFLWSDSKQVTRWGEKCKLSYINLDIDRKNNDYSVLEKHIIKSKVDIFHSPNNGLSLPQKKVCKYIITIHDLLPLRNNTYIDQKYKEKFFNVLPDAVQNSDKIIAVSKFIKNDLINYFKVSEEKISVVYPGCSGQFKENRNENTRQILKSKYNIEDKYILFCGSIHPRKNLETVIKIFNEVKKTNKDLKLIITGNTNGKRSEYTSKLKKLSRDLNISNSVLFTGGVCYKDIPYFYNGAECVINLSDYEGFPLSSIEAIKCNIPVICSRGSSFEEVIGEDGIIVEKSHVSLIKDIICELINNTNYRQAHRSESKQSNNKYNWDFSIKDIVRVYENAAAD